MLRVWLFKCWLWFRGSVVRVFVRVRVRECACPFLSCRCFWHFDSVVLIWWFGLIDFDSEINPSFHSVRSPIYFFYNTNSSDIVSSVLILLLLWSRFAHIPLKIKIVIQCILLVFRRFCHSLFEKHSWIPWNRLFIKRERWISKKYINGEYTQWITLCVP